MSDDPAVRAAVEAAIAADWPTGEGLNEIMALAVEAARPIIEAEVHKALRNDQTDRRRARAAIDEAKADAENYMRILRGRAAVRTEPGDE